MRILTKYHMTNFRVQVIMKVIRIEKLISKRKNRKGLYQIFEACCIIVVLMLIAMTLMIKVSSTFIGDQTDQRVMCLNGIY